VIVAVLLALLGLTESVTVMDRSSLPSQVPLLLALAMTLPVALTRVHAGVAFTLLAVAAGLSVLAQGHIPVSGIIALATVAGTSAYTLYQAKREESARRDANERVMASTLLEHAARGERARIARELHDVVAHHLSMISVQAETARLTTPGMPAEGAKRLTAIGDTARTALTEMRRLLGVLREDAGPAPEPQRRPQPS
jgi:signal transduction histidine kinase